MIWQLVFATLVCGALADLKPGHCHDVPSSAGFDPSEIVGTWKINYHTDSSINEAGYTKCSTSVYTYDNGEFKGTRTQKNEDGEEGVSKSKFVPVDGEPGKFIYHERQADGSYVDSGLKASFYHKDDALLGYGCSEHGAEHKDVVVFLSKQNELSADLKQEAVDYLGTKGVTFDDYYHIDNSHC